MKQLIEISTQLVTILMLGGVLTLVMTGFPIAFVIASVALIMGYILFGGDITYHILYSRMYSMVLSYPFLASSFYFYGRYPANVWNR